MKELSLPSVRFLLAAAGLTLALGACCPKVERRPDKILRKKGYTLINPILDIEPTIEFNELQPFKHELEELVERQVKAGKASHVSVYFRDLNNGPLFGIGEKEKFAPASLAKVPLMIAVLKQAEGDPLLLAKPLAFENPNYNVTPELAPATELVAGQSYTVEQLLEAMIRRSDNGATFTIAREIDKSALEEVFGDLGLLIPDERTPDDYMTVKEYAGFFRILFNASYLNKTMSQKALEILSRSAFVKGIAAGVPRGVTVASKFGERTHKEGGEKKQLHDCGIVYHSRTPYLLCAMTRGKSYEGLLATLREISSLVYQSVDKPAP